MLIDRCRSRPSASWLRRSRPAAWRTTWRLAGLGGVISVTAYAIVLWAQTRGAGRGHRTARDGCHRRRGHRDDRVPRALRSAPAGCGGARGGRGRAAERRLTCRLLASTPAGGRSREEDHAYEGCSFTLAPPGRSPRALCAPLCSGWRPANRRPTTSPSATPSLRGPSSRAADRLCGLPAVGPELPGSGRPRSGPPGLPRRQLQWSSDRRHDPTAAGRPRRAESAAVRPARRRTWLVTLGIGGNDIGFSEIAENCATPYPPLPPPRRSTARPARTTTSSTATTSSAAASPRPPRRSRRCCSASIPVRAAGRDPRRRLPRAPARAGPGCWAEHADHPGDVPYLRDMQKELNAMLRSQALANGADYVDVYTASIGHDVCCSRASGGSSRSFPRHPRPRSTPTPAAWRRWRRSCWVRSRPPEPGRTLLQSGCDSVQVAVSVTNSRRPARSLREAPCAHPGRVHRRRHLGRRRRGRGRGRVSLRRRRTRSTNSRRRWPDSSPPSSSPSRC